MDSRRQAVELSLLDLRPRLIAIAYRIVRDRCEAEEVCDEGLGRWAEALKSTVLENPEAWLTRVVMRLAVDRARRFVRHHPISLSDAHDRASLDPGPLESATANEMRERLWRAVLELPTRQREVIVLHQMEGLKYAEVATLLGIQESSARAQAHSAREALRMKLQSMMKGGDHEL